jgi:small subunit ribosomal protein S13
MPRIAGIDLPDHKKIRFALRYVYGIGPERADEILQLANVNPDTRARDLTSDEVNKIQRLVDKYPVEGNLRRIVNENIDRLKRTKAYRGLRHQAGLPSRGQRTRTNGRTKRGARRTIGAMTKEAAAKLEAAKKSK